MEDIRNEFAGKWDRGEIESWNIRSSVEKSIAEAKKKQEAEAAARRKQQADNIYDIDDDDDQTTETPSEAVPDYSSVESIEAMGADKIKEVLQSMGAKCG